MSAARLPAVLEEIYASGEVVDAEGARLSAFPSGVLREDAVVLNELVRDHDLERTLEVGMAYGLSALAIAAVHDERGSGEHTAIDPWLAAGYRSIGPLNLTRAGLERWVEVIAEGSEVVLPRLVAERPEGFDLVFVDGRHHFDAALLDLFYADLLTRQGGFVAVHDAWLPGVERALAYVLSNRAYEPLLIHEGGLAILRKLHSDEREWDHHVPFESLSVRSWLPDNEAPEGQLLRPTRTAVPVLAPAATLSVCVTTRGPADRVRALLELVRPHADEIVLAVNRDGDPDVLDACADLADRRLTYEFHDSPSRLIGWILNQCSADWILRLDDDEVPSAALLAALPELLRDRRPCEIAMKRRWLFPDPGQMVADPAPWQTEYQSRLLRNLPGAWSFDGRVHSDVVVAGERRLVEMPIYHAALVLSPLDARRERALSYEVLRPGLSYGGLPVNGMYVPELDHEQIALEPVPPEDRAAIERVLAGAPAPAAPGTGAPVTHATAGEVDSFNGTRRVDPEAHRAWIELIAVPERWRAGEERNMELRITNQGTDSWAVGGGDPPVRLGYRWRDRETGRVVFDGRNVFSETVLPGATTLIVLSVEAPAHVGTFQLEVDLVHEHVRWFDCPVTIEARVDPARGTILFDSPRLTEGGFGEALRIHAERLAVDSSRSEAGAEEAAARLIRLRGQNRWKVANAVIRPLDALRRRG